MAAFIYKISFLSLCFFVLNQTGIAQSIPADTSKMMYADTGISVAKNEQAYAIGNGKLLVYAKPKPFAFFTHLPKDAGNIVKEPFRKKSLPPVAVVAGSTLLLLLLDQPIADGVRNFSANIGLQADERYKDVLSIHAGGKGISLINAPQNINTALYQTGQGFPSLLLGAGLFTYGKFKKDYRSLSTASQLAESFILMAAGTQIIKRITGRQSPSNATRRGGAWQFFPSFKQFQNNTPNYDAFPSGHLATLMSTVTTLTENYPEKKYIKPIGYSIIGLVGYAMINNQVHWVSDYPLAIGLGYLCARQVAKHSRRIANQTGTTLKKNKAMWQYSFGYSSGRLMPRLVCTF